MTNKGLAGWYSLPKPQEHERGFIRTALYESMSYPNQSSYPGGPPSSYPGGPGSGYPGAPQSSYPGGPQSSYPGADPSQSSYPGAPQSSYPGGPGGFAPPTNEYRGNDYAGGQPPYQGNPSYNSPPPSQPGYDNQHQQEPVQYDEQGNPLPPGERGLGTMAAGAAAGWGINKMSGGHMGGFTSMAGGAIAAQVGKKIFEHMGNKQGGPPGSSGSGGNNFFSKFGGGGGSGNQYGGPPPPGGGYGAPNPYGKY
ncbi:hypothetical protein IE53DRAFT_413156 [Violaceomyces palustris]|uniref:Uncharacterized protein n=1 Tax=Violaceomyces palustris TaxID=1673888 RepID=A0ACD0NN69_9BASI|nr:hypothetical protein IE53DRAFT_413156 [Violaceomyces palustris]